MDTTFSTHHGKDRRDNNRQLLLESLEAAPSLYQAVVEYNYPSHRTGRLPNVVGRHNQLHSHFTHPRRRNIMRTLSTNNSNRNCESNSVIRRPRVFTTLLRQKPPPHFRIVHFHRRLRKEHLHHLQPRLLPESLDATLSFKLY